MADQQKAPLDAHAIELITALANEGAAPAMLNITTSNLGPGLPSSLPVGFNRKNQEFVSLKSRIEEFRTAPDRRKGTATGHAPRCCSPCRTRSF